MLRIDYSTYLQHEVLRHAVSEQQAEISTCHGFQTTLHQGSIEYHIYVILEIGWCPFCWETELYSQTGYIQGQSYELQGISECDEADATDCPGGWTFPCDGRGLCNGADCYDCGE